MFNQVTVAGRITKELDLKRITDDTAVLNFSVAMNEKRGADERTVFVDVTAWNGTAENTAKFMGKGSSVLISGHLSQDNWEEGGRTRTKLFITAERIVFIQSKPKPQPATTSVDPVAKRTRRKTETVG